MDQNKERELAYIVRIDAITSMNADRLECAHINGWHCVVGKGEFHVGDYAVFFEIDSKLPDKFPFSEMEFLKSKKFCIKTQKIRGEYSQGLLVPLSAFINRNGSEPAWLMAVLLRQCNGDDITNYPLTKELEVTYSTPEDNIRKAPSIDKYKVMVQRHPKLFKLKPIRWLARHAWGKKLLFMFFGKKKDKKNAWPEWVTKTDETRCQNMPWLFTEQTGEEWFATEKVDGSSSTFTMRKHHNKYDFYVCSRNVVMTSEDQKCFYDTNIYREMAEKYNMREACEKAFEYWAMNNRPLQFVTFQGEVYGGNIQKRHYGDEHRLAIFNVIFGFKDGAVTRLNPVEMQNFLREIQTASANKLEAVPIVDTHFVLPKTCEELLKMAEGESKIDGGMREGLVFRSTDGTKSFKAVSNEYLLKYHS